VIFETTQQVLDLLDWNRRHLTFSSELTEELIANKFAPSLEVRANGRVYQANHASYKEFLDGFRQKVASIDYKVHKIVADAESAVVAMSATVTRSDSSVERFEAMLLLSFDMTGLVSLWHEVYVRTA
jgi:hypothetical protein